MRPRRTGRPRRPTTALFDKWDDIYMMDEDDDTEDSGRKPLPGPRDMAYTPQHILRQNDRFVAIREAGGAELTHDVYARSDSASDNFWFVGKAAAVSDVPVELAVARQWNLIEEHASRLRPLELFPVRGSMELWTAPGDSELDVAYNRPHIRFVEMARTDEVDGALKVRAVEVGFQGEMYDPGEEGFRTLRNDDGLPKNKEVMGPEDGEKGPKRAPTDEEMKDIQEMLKGKDLNELFKDQK